MKEKFKKIFDWIYSVNIDKLYNIVLSFDKVNNQIHVQFITNSDNKISFDTILKEDTFNSDYRQLEFQMNLIETIGLVALTFPTKFHTFLIK